MRKPLIPSQMTTFINMLIRRRRVTPITCVFARGGSRHGMKIDVPLLNARQLISYLTPSTSIGLLGWGTHKIAYI